MTARLRIARAIGMTLLGAATLFATPAMAARTLAIGLSGDVTSIDPHFHNVTPNANVAEHIFDTLITKDEKMKLKPSLALSWKPIDDTTWEVKLRPNVKFHDGSEFTADDVVFSLARPATIKDSPSPYTIYTRAIVSATAPDKLTVRLKTAAPYPLMPNDLSTIYIVSKKAAANATKEDFTSGRASIGTGPFKFVKFEPGSRIELARNDAYWGGKSEWDTVTLRILTNDAARVAALLANDVQVIENVPTADYKKLETNAALTLARTTSFRLMYLHLDTARDKSPMITDAAGKPLEKNPLKDVRVRQAISKAIARPALADRVMEGLAEPTGQLMNSSMFGYDARLKPEIYDPDGARKLLAEAGYPDGFNIAIDATNNRYVNDDQLAQTISAMLSRVGIRTKVEAMPSSVFFTRANKLDFSLMLVGWGADTGEASSTLKSLLATYDAGKGWGVSNRGRYSNAVLDAKLTDAMATVDDKKREGLLQEATVAGLSDYGVIPLFFNVSVWALRRGYTIVPRMDERTLASAVKGS
ncbi:ABC transporter substrate-binding protein [soil metagenome]